ncbi:MAG: hypothetical protein KA052_00615 [Candidatus Pacebacteria bacterium]|nr:hypothetical protein [Candidatus Paceibacterota bacterium]
MTTTIGIFSTHAEAENALAELRAFGVAEENLSYIYVDAKGAVVDNQSGEKIGGSAVSGVAAGAAIGTLAGLAIAEGVVPGLGAFLVAGPLAAALGLTGIAATAVSGAVTGAAAGGLIGALSGVGVSDTDAVRFQEYVRHGDVLVVVHAAPGSVRDVLARAHAREIQEYVT